MTSNMVFSSQSDPIYYIKWALSILNCYALYSWIDAEFVLFGLYLAFTDK